jgi:TonB family protein
VVREHASEVQACWEHAGAQTPGVSGRVVLAWTIGPDGHPSNASVVDSTLPESMGAATACVTDAVMRWMFPVPPGQAEVHVTYPFDLTTE